MKKPIDVPSYTRMPQRFWPSKTVSDATILVLWKGGFDTCGIGVTLGIPEHEIERRLHLAKDAARSTPTVHHQRTFGGRAGPGSGGRTSRPHRDLRREVCMECS